MTATNDRLDVSGTLSDSERGREARRWKTSCSLSLTHTLTLFAEACARVCVRACGFHLALIRKCVSDPEQ